MPIWVNFTKEKEDSEEIIVVFDLRKATLKEWLITMCRLIFKGVSVVKVSNPKMIKSIEHFTKKRSIGSDNLIKTPRVRNLIKL